jgi:CheY-like chemotaxis protein
MPEPDKVVSGRCIQCAIRALLTGKVGMIAITGRGTEEDRQRWFEAGFGAHLVKPVLAGTLKQVPRGAGL